MALLFNILFFLIPLVFYKGTSEIFEFNKINILYIFTTLIVSRWLIKSIKVKKFIFSRTILDIPLFIYLSVLVISTIFSINPNTSIFGYYSRFNGGLISQACYALLYWAYVSNLNKDQTLKTIYFLLLSVALTSIFATLEHFAFFTTCGLMGLGFNTSCWVQDVQTRVFSTIGQPNWLAALLVAVIPITWAYSLKSLRLTIFSILFFIALIFTHSRSGMLGLGIEFFVFWAFVFLRFKFKFVKQFIFLNFVYFLLFIFFNVLPKYSNDIKSDNNPQGPALEVGGTESGTIRKYVWIGAINVFKNYPLIGSGPETFAYTFPMFKPISHNLTSEWDYIYNKAHNEYLNYLANTGTLGLLSYLTLIFIFLYQTAKILFKELSINNSRILNNWLLTLAIFSGYLSILATNFFGFSVVITSLLFFIFPAMIVAIDKDEVAQKVIIKFNIYQKVAILLILFICIFILYSIYNYWKADIYYNNAKIHYQDKKINDANLEINKALYLNSDEPLYLSLLAKITNSNELIEKVMMMNQYDQNINNTALNIYVSSNEDVESTFYKIENLLITNIKRYPNDPANYIKLAKLYSGFDTNQSELLFLKVIELKPNYKDARFYLGMLYKLNKENIKAKEQFEYILKYIDSKDELTKTNLLNLK